MPNYFYIAKSFDGKDQTGVLFAESPSQLAKNLKDQNMLLIKADVEGEGKIDWKHLSLPSLGVSQVEKLMMTRNLWIMFGSGLSLVKIFDILAGQAKNQKLKNIMLDINQSLNKGASLSDSLEKYPKVFNNFFVSMVKIGEESGTLDEVFGILSTHMDRDHELRSKIRGALIYPCIVLVVMVIIGGVIATFVLPKFTEFLVGMDIELPIYTRILIAISNFAQQFWYLSILAPMGLFYGFFLAMKSKTGRLARDTMLIKMPLISPFIKKTNSAVIIRSLSSLNASGISLVRSLEITSATAGNVYFKKALAQAIDKVKKGEKLSNALRPYKDLFPFGAIDMMEVGEETGKTSDILKRLAEFYEQEVIELAKNFSVIIEPLLIIFLGLCVAFFAISIIAPMYSSFQNIE